MGFVRKIRDEGRLDLKPYFKVTNRILYLPWISVHPTAMNAGIIIGEGIRTLRNSSEKFSLLEVLHYIFKGLLTREYPATVIKKSWKRIRWADREFYVKHNSSKQAPAGTLVFTRYHPETKYEWNKLTKRHPFENIFLKRSYKRNKLQVSIMTHWPPKIVWCPFRKIRHHIISARQSWHYSKMEKGSNSMRLLENATKRSKKI